MIFTALQNILMSRIAEEPLELGKDEYFCLGDNRPVSYDSRYEEVGRYTVQRLLVRCG